MASLAKAVGGRAFSRSLPLAQWGQDVRALGFLRPPWPLRKTSFSNWDCRQRFERLDLALPYGGGALFPHPRCNILWDFKPGSRDCGNLDAIGHSLEPESLNTETPSQLIDAATVVVVRDRPEANGGTHMEVLMYARAPKCTLAAWVFPGGRVDDEERSRSDEAEIEGFKRAAVREAQEEAAIDLSDAALVHFSHWLPPPIRPKRFSNTFLAKVEAVDFDIQVDGGEITDHQW